jgi:putative inorganic carbon (hco3(-)) transporter
MSMILLYIYLINLYIRPQDWVPLFLGWPVDFIIIIPTLIIGIIKNQQDKSWSPPFPQHHFLAAFLVCVFLSNLVHFNIASGWEELILFFKKICVFYVFFLVVKTQKSLLIAIAFILCLTVVLGVQAIYQTINSGIGWAGQGYYAGFSVDRVRWIGLWDGANIFALLLSLAVPFALEFTFGPYPFIYRVFSSIAIGIIGYAIFLTNSKGGFITFLGIIFFYFAVRIKNKSAAIVAIIVVLIVGALAPSRITIQAVLGDTGRAHLWEQGIMWFKENPLLGIGKGHFQDDSFHHLVAHSNFIQNAAEVGIIGLFVFVGMVYYSFKGLFLTQKKLKELGKTDISLYSSSRAILISFIGFNICTLFITMEIDIFYAWLGLCAVAFNVLNREVAEVKMAFSKKDFRNIFLIIIGMFFLYWLKT